MNNDDITISRETLTTLVLAARGGRRLVARNEPSASTLSVFDRAIALGEALLDGQGPTKDTRIEIIVDAEPLETLDARMGEAMAKADVLEAAGFAPDITVRSDQRPDPPAE